MLANFLELNSKGLHQSSGKEKESCCLLFPSSTKREIRQFHVVVVQRRQRNVQKSVMHVQTCCFACLNLSLFCLSCCCRRPRCVNSLLRDKRPLSEIGPFREVKTTVNVPAWTREVSIGKGLTARQVTDYL